MTKKVLIVDDSKVSRMLIKQQILVKEPTWQIQEAASGEEAVAKVDVEQPDYCTMDINMPGILGTEAAEQILEKYPTIRIVIFTANIQETYQEKARELGTILIAKPVTEKTIAVALEHFAGAE